MMNFNLKTENLRREREEVGKGRSHFTIAKFSLHVLPLSCLMSLGAHP